MNIKAFVGRFKIINWFKGIIFAILGLLHSRFGVGFNWFVDNLIFGAIIYFLVVFSSMMMVLAFKRPQEKTGDILEGRDIVVLVSIVVFVLAYGIVSYVVFYYERSILIIIILAVIGLILGISLFYGIDWKYKSILTNLIIGFSTTFGLIYASFLNDVFIPTYVYFFFLGAFSLQFSKDIIKSCRDVAERREENGTYKPFAEVIRINRTQNIALAFQILTIIFLLVPFLTGVYNYFLYMFPMIIAALLVGLSIILNLIYDFEEEYKGKVFLLLRLAMFFTIVAILFAGI
jgi:4-hydroxybenzoate polyprenyltransferase